MYLDYLLSVGSFSKLFRLKIIINYLNFERYVVQRTGPFDWGYEYFEELGGHMKELYY